MGDPALGFAAGWNINQKFTGQERDDETGLDFFQARYLASVQGRFISPDPGNAGANPYDPQSWNAYAYVGNNPLNSVDPSGYCTIKVGQTNATDDPDEPCDVLSARKDSDKTLLLEWMRLTSLSSPGFSAGAQGELATGAAAERVEVEAGDPQVNRRSTATPFFRTDKQSAAMYEQDARLWPAHF